MSDFVAIVASPCIRKCCLNEHDICLGCFRSLDEIKLWTQVNDQQRRHFLIAAEQRKQIIIKKSMEL